MSGWIQGENGNLYKNIWTKISKSVGRKYREALRTISQVQTRSARFRRCTKKAAKSLCSKRLISQRCKVVFQLVVFGFHHDGKLQGGIHSTVQKGCEIISQQKGDFAALCKILPLAWSDRLAMDETYHWSLKKVRLSLEGIKGTWFHEEKNHLTHTRTGWLTYKGTTTFFWAAGDPSSIHSTSKRNTSGKQPWNE